MKFNQYSTTYILRPPPPSSLHLKGASRAIGYILLDEIAPRNFWVESKKFQFAILVVLLFLSTFSYSFSFSNPTPTSHSDMKAYTFPSDLSQLHYRLTIALVCCVCWVIRRGVLREMEASSFLSFALGVSSLSLLLRILAQYC